VITLAFSFVFPWLGTLLVVQGVAKNFRKAPHGWCLTPVLALVSGIIVFIPIGGLPLARWLIGINANFSFPLVAMAFNKAWENASGSRLLDRTASTASWIFGLVAGLVLYPMALGLGDFDPYSLGWGFSWLFAFLELVTILLLLMKNRFAVVLIVCILGYDLNLLESPNLWDYLVDPFFVFFSFVGMSSRLVGWMRKAPLDKKGIDGLEQETTSTA
jgi:hypothetical protein